MAWIKASSSIETPCRSFMLRARVCSGVRWEWILIVGVVYAFDAVPYVAPAYSGSVQACFCEASWCSCCGVPVSRSQPWAACGGVCLVVLGEGESLVFRVYVGIL